MSTDNNKILLIVIGTLVILFGIIIFNKQPAETDPISNLIEESNQSSESTPTMNTTSNNNKYSTAPAMQLEQNKDYKAVIKTSKGDITVDLFETEAPITVNNFVFLAKDNFYNNTRFHRIIKGFMIQGGDPAGNGTGGPGYNFDDEPVTREYSKGIIAMANRGPNTNGSQFFIMHADYPLPKNYTIFGQATDSASLAVIDAIAETPVRSGASGEASTPTEEITISEVVIQ